MSPHLCLSLITPPSCSFSLSRKQLVSGHLGLNLFSEGSTLNLVLTLNAMTLKKMINESAVFKYSPVDIPFSQNS